MDLPQAAAEHLGVIRRLMERATLYRALSAPTALLAGLLSLAVASAQIVFHGVPGRSGLEGGTAREQAIGFIAPWLAVLLAVALTSAWAIQREARARGELFVTSGMRLALRQMAPAFAAAAFFTVADLVAGGEPLGTVARWLLFYGLALLSTSVFAPHSLVALGAAFFGAALSFGCVRLFGYGPGPEVPGTVAAAWLMMSTFGFFHLVYAAFAWRGETLPPPTAGHD